MEIDEDITSLDAQVDPPLDIPITRACARQLSLKVSCITFLFRWAMYHCFGAAS